MTKKQISRLRFATAAVGGLFLSGALAMAQAVKPDNAPASGSAIPVTNQPATTVPVDDDVIVLSPFQVDSTKEKGYFAENTLAGSRMRTNIADLGAAISVVTKQQMEDTGSLDINDVFRYEIGTEGAATYTPIVYNSSRADGVFESIGGSNIAGGTTAATNATSNRIRGLGSPSFALNYYQAISQVPFDSYNTASIEINRGPNSMLFGMGSPAGIVNQSTAQALINKNNGQIQLRIDDRGSNRASLNFNKSLIKDKLAIYGALLYNDQQFERKPSYDISRRAYGAITYRPFKTTTIRASVEGYNNDNRRPNSISPIDTVSEWRAAGMPLYDASTRSFVSQATGKTISKFAPSKDSSNAQDVRDFIKTLPGYSASNWKNANGTADATQSNYNGVSIFGSGAFTNVSSALYVPGMGTYNARTILQIEDGKLQNWFQPLGGNRPATSLTGGTTLVYPFSTTDTAADYVYKNSTYSKIYDWYQMDFGAWSLGTTPTTTEPYYGTKTYKGVTDRSIYDYKKINALSMNYGNQRNTNYNLELEQQIIPELLHFSAGWFRQDFDSMQSYTVGQLNATNLFVDVNMYTSDGKLNPYAGRPYVRDTDAIDHMLDSQTVDQYRAMLAFTPDFTKNKGWTKWLGRHNIMGLASYYDQDRTTFRRRLNYAYGDEAGKLRYNLWNTAAGWKVQNSATQRRYFYLDAPGATPGNGSVTQSAGMYTNDPIEGSIVAYDYTTNQFTTIDMGMTWNVHDNGTTKAQRTLNSYSAGWTGYLWQDRIITTAGVRRDINKTRTTNASKPASITQAEWDATYWKDGLYQYQEMFKRWNDWSRLAGTTKTYGAVVKPFSHWLPISSRAGNNLFWEFVDNFGFSFNKSDNFDAPPTTYVDPFGKVLPKPEGTGKDYGVQFSLFKNKLFARVNWFESNNNNTPNDGALPRLTGHVDTTAFRGWLEMIYMLNDGANPSTTNWTDPYTSGKSNYDKNKRAAMETWVGNNLGAGMKNDYNYYANMPGGIRGTISTEAKGVELSVNYNPLPNWTIKVTGGKVTTTNANSHKEIDAWLAVRAPVWDNAKASDYLNATGAATLASLGGADNFQISTDAASTKKGNLTTFWDSYNYKNGSGSTTIDSDNKDGWTTSRGYYNAVFTPNYALQVDQEGQQAMGQRKYNGTVITNYAFDRSALKGWSVGGAQRWADKAIIGYMGKKSGINKDAKGNPMIDASDVTRPLYDDAEWHTDLWIAYTRKIFNDKVRMKLQLNVSDVFENGGLKPIRKDWLGEAYSYRIVDSRQFILTATFDF